MSKNKLKTYLSRVILPRGNLVITIPVQATSWAKAHELIWATFIVEGLRIPRANIMREKS